MRRCHFLRGNKGAEFPHQAIWVDTETTEIGAGPGRVRHVLRFGWACYQRTIEKRQWTEPEWFRFERADDFWTWVEERTRPRTRLYLFAHNWSFDAPVLSAFSILPLRGWRLTRIVIESPPVILAWRRGRVTLEMLDTLNFYTVPLSVLGEHLGVAKLPHPAKDAGAEEWDRYCRQDAEVIRQAMLRWWTFLAEHDLGGFAKTLAGQAMRAYRHGRMPARILIDADVRALMLARDALFGGRTEAFRIGRVNERIVAYDVNSMYPSAMAEHSFPTVLRLWCRRPTRREFLRWLDRYCVVARVKLETRSPQYPYRLEGRLVFPVGRFRTCLTTPELQAAVEQGHLIEVEEIALYDSAPIFGHYVGELHHLRVQAIKAGDGVRAYMLKLLLNGLYGKWSQRGQTWHTIGQAEDDGVGSWTEVDADTGEVHEMRRLCGVLQERRHEPESQESHPAISAHVTAWARRRLWELMEIAGSEHVVYCDTDSLYTVWPYGRKLEAFCHPYLLGALRLEGEYDWMVVNGAKDYVRPDKWVCKGVREKALWLSPRRIIQEEWTTLRGLVELGNLEAPVTTQRVVTLSSRYAKGHVSRSGVVTPLRLREW